MNCTDAAVSGGPVDDKPVLWWAVVACGTWTKDFVHGSQLKSDSHAVPHAGMPPPQHVNQTPVPGPSLDVLHLYCLQSMCQL
jgi:hypothetical protein